MNAVVYCSVKKCPYITRTAAHSAGTPSASDGPTWAVSPPAKIAHSLVVDRDSPTWRCSGAYLECDLKPRSASITSGGEGTLVKESGLT